LVNESRLRQLNAKMAQAMIALAKMPENGGMPFYYSLAAGRRFKLRSSEQFAFCATNGNEIYFTPEHIENTEVYDLALDIAHEVHHIVSMHCISFSDPMQGKNVPPPVAKFLHNIMLDIYCDSTIDLALDQSNYSGKRWGKHKKITYQHLLNMLSGNAPPMESWSCIDHEVLKKNPGDIYKEIESYWLSGNKKFGGGGVSGKDGHIPGNSEQSKNDIIQDIIKAKEMAKLMSRGNLPGILESLIGELLVPQIDMGQYLNQQMFSHLSNVSGDVSNHKRCRRKYIWQDMYLPSKKTPSLRWLGLIDTSGSMHESKEAAISQLQTLPPQSQGFIVPADAEIYWDKYTTIFNLEDLQFTDVTGGGGTVLHPFFRDYRYYFDDDFDVIYILTDGYIDVEEIAKYPVLADVFWIVVNNPGFSPPFGQVLHVDHNLREVR
jgi:predicted metal-dependent peptidase